MPKKASRSSVPATEVELPLRITLKGPPAGAVFCVQGKDGEYFSTTVSTGADITFEVVVRAVDGDPPRLLGKVTQGPPAQRFIYICSGTYAGETVSHWGRRAKVPLTGITPELIANAKRGARLSASIPGIARDGGPVCASVKLLGSGWQWKR